MIVIIIILLNCEHWAPLSFVFQFVFNSFNTSEYYYDFYYYNNCDKVDIYFR